MRIYYYIKCFLEDLKATSAVEFALLAPIIFTLLIGTIDYGFYVVQRMELQSVSVAVAEYVMMKEDNDNIMTVADEVYSGSVNDLLVDFGYECECADGGVQACPLSCAGDDYQRRYITVSVTRDHQILFPYPGFDSSVSLQSVARMRVD